MRRIFRVIAVVGAVLLGLVFTVPVSATSLTPNTNSISAVEAFQNVLETGDQLYVVAYNIAYYPDPYPAENATTTWFVTVMDGDGITPLATASPVSYYQQGYEQGVVMIYFTAADAPTWDNGESVVLSPNPLTTWSPSTPNPYTYSTPSWSSSTSMASTATELKNYIISLATVLSGSWSNTDMVSSVGGNSVLGNTGQDYFSFVWPYLSQVCPSLFGVASSGGVEWPNTKAPATGVQAAIDAEMSGTPFDITDTANTLNWPKSFTGGVFWAGICIGAMILTIKAVGSFKPVTLVLVFMMILGARFGFVPVYAAVLIGFLGLVMAGWVFFYDKSFT